MVDRGTRRRVSPRDGHGGREVGARLAGRRLPRSLPAVGNVGPRRASVRHDAAKSGLGFGQPHAQRRDVVDPLGHVGDHAGDLPRVLVAGFDLGREQGVPVRHGGLVELELGAGHPLFALGDLERGPARALVVSGAGLRRLRAARAASSAARAASRREAVSWVVGVGSSRLGAAVVLVVFFMVGGLSWKGTCSGFEPHSSEVVVLVVVGLDVSPNPEGRSLRADWTDARAGSPVRDRFGLAGERNPGRVVFTRPL